MTTVELQEQYLANLDYDTKKSARKAALCLEALRGLLIVRPKRWKHGGNEEMEFSPESVQAEIARAERWLAENRGDFGGRVVHLDLQDFRE